MVAQTLLDLLYRPISDIQHVKPGYSEGSFVVIREIKEQKDHSTVPLVTFSQEKLENSGLLQRFLHWIAKGAEESNMGRTSCPT
jgi:hypothetical protein